MKSSKFKKLQKKFKPKSRKEQRKEKRQQKKVNRSTFHGQKKNQQKSKNNDEADQKFNNEFDNEEIESDFDLSDEELEEKTQKSKAITVSAPKKQKIDKPYVDPLERERNREMNEKKNFEKGLQNNRMEKLKEDNEEEDKLINKLEKQLGLKKKKTDVKVPKSFGDDGLDYVLELCLPDNIKKMYDAAKQAADEDEDFNDDLTAVINPSAGSSKRKKNKKSKDVGSTLLTTKEERQMLRLREIEKEYFNSDDDLDSDLNEEDSEFENDDNNEDGEDMNSDDEIDSEMEETEEEDEDEDDDDDDGDEDLDDKMTEISEEDESDDSVVDELDENEEDSEEDSENDKKQSSTNKNHQKEWEDIYGRKRDKDGNLIQESTGKYVPPHIRAKLEAANGGNNEKLIRLRKQLKGLINKLAEDNIHKIAIEIEKLYMNNPRFDMNNVLFDLMSEALISNVLAKERMVLEHALLIAILHVNVGNEIGAQFLQSFVERFNTLLEHIDDYEVENKEIDNVLFIICHMCTFKIFHHNLIYEILNKITEELNEKRVECVLLALRAIGFSLRKQDPIALKNLITSLQKKASEAPDDLRQNVRLKFMLDVLLAIKNNNVNKIPHYDPTIAEHLKKIMKAVITKGKYMTTMNISLEDLLKADERGKWWVVGSAWTGNINDIGNAKDITKSKNNSPEFSDKLLALAKKQRMNTVDRKNVFCAIMSAEDYIDAFDKVMRLAIKDRKAVVSVIIHCCLSEKQFNPYYAVLSQKFGDADRQYRESLKLVLWDKIEDVHNFSITQLKNLAQFIIYLIENKVLPLSVLKIVKFDELDKVTLRLVRQIVLGVLLTKDETVFQQVFEFVSINKKLDSFKTSLLLFLDHFLFKGGKLDTVEPNHRKLLEQRIKVATKYLKAGFNVRF